jgi:hypothetical protein
MFWSSSAGLASRMAPSYRHMNFKRRALRSSPDGADGIRESAQQRRDTEAALHTEVKKRRKG